MPTNLEELQAKKDQLQREYQAIQQEYSAGRSFLTGAAEADREARETAKFQELSAVNQQIRAETGQNAAQGQTVESRLQNVSTPNQAAATLSPDEKSKLNASKSGSLSSKIDQSQDPTTSTKQNTNAVSGKSEANFSADVATNNSGSVIGNNVTGNNSDYSAEKASAPPENILHNYTSYTYRITLFFLTSKDYNNLAANPSTFTPKYSMISSAGGYATKMSDLVAEETRTGKANYNQTLRHPDFQTDFFIDNLSIQTIVGLNAKTKASNAVDISFTITEPYGLSLLDRLLSACETSEDASVNYMTQPYLLQIDMLASPTDEQLNGMQAGNNVITSKKIAVKLIEMKIKPTGTGTTYAVKAMPYNHAAFDITAASLPVPMNIDAGTVGEFFSSSDDLVKLFTGQITSQEERLEQDIEKWIKSNTIIFANQKPTAEQIENQKRALKNAIEFSSKSLTAAYNTYNDNIAKEKKLSTLPPTKIAFNIPDDEIAKSPIVNPADSSSTDTSMGSQSTGVGKTDPKGKAKQGFSFNAGTSIIDIIDTVMSKSEYIKKQIKTKGTDRKSVV